MRIYPLWLCIFVFLPLLIIWLFEFKKLRKYGKVILLAEIGSFVFATPWDMIAVKDKIWYFTEPHILGIWLFGLPIEEYLFIIFVALLFVSITLLIWERWGTS